MVWEIGCFWKVAWFLSTLASIFINSLKWNGTSRFDGFKSKNWWSVGIEPRDSTPHKPSLFSAFWLDFSIWNIRYSSEVFGVLEVDLDSLLSLPAESNGLSKCGCWMAWKGFVSSDESLSGEDAWFKIGTWLFDSVAFGWGWRWDGMVAEVERESSTLARPKCGDLCRIKSTRFFFLTVAGVDEMGLFLTGWRFSGVNEMRGGVETVEIGQLVESDKCRLKLFIFAWLSMVVLDGDWTDFNPCRVFTSGDGVSIVGFREDGWSGGEVGRWLSRFEFSFASRPSKLADKVDFLWTDLMASKKHWASRCSSDTIAKCRQCSSIETKVIFVLESGRVLMKIFFKCSIYSATHHDYIHEQLQNIPSTSRLDVCI